jgi:hypothetical protein
VVFTVRVAVSLEPLTVTEGAMEQVIFAVAGGGAQERVTVPLNPFTAATVTVEVPTPPGDAIVTDVPPTV